MQSVIEFLASEKWARVLGSLVAIVALVTAVASLAKRKNKTGLYENVSSGDDLKTLWNQLNPDMQDAFVLANNERKRLGHDQLHTELLFQALVRLGSPDLMKIADLLPKGALPEATVETSVTENTLFEDKPALSGCVKDSVSSYLKAGELKRELTPVDMFIDIGKHGKGKSVARLREHGVDVKMLEDVASRLGFDLVRRPEPA